MNRHRASKRGDKDQRYIDALNGLVDDLFDDATLRDGMPIKLLAAKAGIGLATVYNLFHGLTHRPQHRTIWRLNNAVKSRHKARTLALRRIG